jgi:hypothetical protein
MTIRFLLAAALAIAGLQAQVARVQPANAAAYPSAIVDGNSPSVWINGQLRVYTSTGRLLAMSGESFSTLSMTTPPAVTPAEHFPMWIESVWLDADGTLYAWYHHEPERVCVSQKLTAPKIGALVSYDGGQSFLDLGIVLSTGEAINCNSENGFFGGGHGDFSVIPDREGEYFYFLFGNYSGPLHRQGVSIARMAFEDRANPLGMVKKFYLGAWSEPGLGGLTTPVFPATVGWERSNADSFWGPSIHWNTYLESYVIVMNRACCKSGWPQDGIYFSANEDLSDPGGWSRPAKILDDGEIGFAPGYYPQVVGMGPGESDSLAGKVARLYVKGISHWEVEFFKEGEIDPPENLPEPPSGDPSTGMARPVSPEPQAAAPGRRRN